jgi:hypothetical protein
MVLASGQGSKLIHGFLDNARNSGIVYIDCLAAGKINIRILGRPAHHRTVRGKSPLPVSDHKILINDCLHIIFGELLNFLDLMGGPETIKEMHEGDPGFQS